MLSHTGRLVTPRRWAAISRIGQCHRYSGNEMVASNWNVLRRRRRSTPHVGAARAPGDDEPGAEGRDGHERAGVDAGRRSR